MVTALYARVSTDAQAEEGYSIDIQGERLEAYCNLKGYESFEHYIDGGYYGLNGLICIRPLYRSFCPCSLG